MYAHLRHPLYAGSFLKTPQDVENLVVRVVDDTPIYVRDVANVSWANEEASNFVNYYTGPAYAEAFGADKQADGDLAVTVALAKKEGSNGVTVANDILTMVESLKGRLIPDQVQVEVTRNYGATADSKATQFRCTRILFTG